MKTLEQQLRDYGTAIDEVFDATRLDDLGEVRLAAEPPSEFRHRRGLLVLVAAAVAVLVGLGLLPLLLDRSQDVVNEPVEPPTITETEENQSETSLGTLTWTVARGDETSLPSYVSWDDREGTYLAVEDEKIWRSDDGLQWRATTLPELEGKDAELLGELVAISGDSGSQFFELRGTSLREVGLAAVSSGIEGLEWFHSPAEVIEIDGATVITGLSYGVVDWDSYVCGSTDPCPDSVQMTWDPEIGAFHLSSATTGELIKTVTLTRLGSVLQFVDIEGGPELRRVTAPDEATAAAVADDLIEAGAFFQSTVWRRSNNATTFESISVPWQGHAGIFETGSGQLVAVEQDVLPSPEAPKPPRVWTTTDGVSWVDQGVPELADGYALQYIASQRGDAVHIAAVTDFDTYSGGDAFVEYLSTDGLNWSLVDSGLPFLAAVVETNFGYVASALPQTEWLYYVSADGVVWEQVEGPPDRHEPTDAGYTQGSGVGDILYMAVGPLDAGARTLWIGRFEQP